MQETSIKHHLSYLVDRINIHFAYERRNTIPQNFDSLRIIGFDLLRRIFTRLRQQRVYY